MNPTVDVIKEGRITSEFGPREAPTPGASTTHNAIDYVTSEGKVFSPVTGVVIEEGFDEHAGNYIKIRSLFDKSTHVLAHLRDRSVIDKGNLVSVGAFIGYMGSTGTSTGDHVHWSIKDDKNLPIDNSIWLGIDPLTRGEILNVIGELDNGKLLYSVDITNANIESEGQTPGSEVDGKDYINNNGIDFTV